MPEWTQELKDEVVKKYKAADPTPETSTEIVKSIAEDMGDDFTVNGVRVILVKADVYVKKTTSAPKKDGEKKSTRVNKADAIQALTDAIEASGSEADSDILSKLTGKAAVYFTEILTANPE